MSDTLLALCVHVSGSFCYPRLTCIDNDCFQNECIKAESLTEAPFRDWHAPLQPCSSLCAGIVKQLDWQVSCILWAGWLSGEIGLSGSGSFGRSWRGRGGYGDDRKHSSILFMLPMSPNTVRGHILFTCANEIRRSAPFCLCWICKQRQFVPHSSQDREAADGHHLSKNGLNAVKKCRRQCRFYSVTWALPSSLLHYSLLGLKYMKIALYLVGTGVKYGWCEPAWQSVFVCDCVLK